MTQAQVICHALFCTATQAAIDAALMRKAGQDAIAEEFERQEFEARVVLQIVENGEPLDLGADVKGMTYGQAQRLGLPVGQNQMTESRVFTAEEQERGRTVPALKSGLEQIQLYDLQAKEGLGLQRLNAPNGKVKK